METTLCRVCGAFARWRHYNAITCTSCKIFFRRHAEKRQEFQCKFLNNCKVYMLKRNSCQKCRLEKCFAIGMETEWIMSEEENQSDGEGNEEYPISTSHTENEELNNRERLMFKGLIASNEEFKELIAANEEFKLPLDCGVNDPTSLDVISLSGHAIQRLITMSRKIKGFKNLCQDDQIALLMGGCIELLILRSVMYYNPEKECWEHIVTQGPKIMSMKVDILKEARGNIYEEHKRFITSFHPQWRSDENIMFIINAIVLFTPERTNIGNKEAIKIEQDSYYYLLRVYLHSVYSLCEAEAMYLKLTHKIGELHILNENHAPVYLNINLYDGLPFLIEINDFKH